jgi:predicted kinase
MKKAILSMGLPASGKTTIIQKITKHNNITVIDCDIIKKEIKGFDPLHPDKVHNESQILTEELFTNTVKNGNDLIYDSTATNLVKMINKIETLRKNAYDIEIVYTKVCLETAIKRNSLRDRKVPLHIIIEKHLEIEKTYDRLSKKVKSFIIEND